MSLVQMKIKILEKTGLAFDLMTCKAFNVRTAVIQMSGGLADQIGWYGYGLLLHERFHVSVEYEYEEPVAGSDAIPHLPRTLQCATARKAVYGHQAQARGMNGKYI